MTAVGLAAGSSGTVGGGSGDDVIKVRAGRIDDVSCGSGNDTVRAGANDIIAKDCEKVTN